MQGKSTPKKGVQLRFAGSYLKNESAFQVEKIVIANLKSIYMNVCFCLIKFTKRCSGRPFGVLVIFSFSGWE